MSLGWRKRLQKWTENVESKVCGLRDNKNAFFAEVGKLAGPSLAEGSGIGTDIAGTAMDLFLEHGVLFPAKRG